MGGVSLGWLLLVQNRMSGSRRLASDKPSAQMVSSGYSFLKTLAALAFGLTIAGCAGGRHPNYPNVVPIDKTGNFGAR